MMLLMMMGTCVPPRRPSHSRKKTPQRSPSPPSQLSSRPDNDWTLYSLEATNFIFDLILNNPPALSFETPVKKITPTATMVSTGGSIFRLTISHPELSQDHVLPARMLHF